ncbi:cell division suppressor protein YneA [Psychrobacillus vulpis]|uniref:LysM peptidoglycan-binding domain-containing protein n=1 Tax=Psychrobacillus vulpis TaxID=2325572 RepID=A0A544TUC0_9BACI|nr:LysM peptidoglycan-binding domain-containing protein [Psychrobacillus vulpis]TQR21046.1 LysM peptidoglycan-binding domain-containing protein [Psychrobacillus vulpis]
MDILKKNYFLTIFLGLSISFIMTIVIFNTNLEKEDYRITIEHGDSLWTLAEKFGTEEPKESWINQVMTLNNLHSAHIKAGDVLTIPKGKKEQFQFDHKTELAGDSQ